MAPAQDGQSERDHLLAYERATGRRAPELDTPPLPPGCDSVWGAFTELHQARASNGVGFCAIAWRDVQAWQQVRGVALTGWELETIQVLDRLALATLNKKRPQTKG